MKRLLFLTGLSLLSILLLNYSATAQLSEGLVAYYPFNGNAHDMSGNGVDGVVSGATLVEGWDGTTDGAYYFDGLDDMIAFPQDQFISSNHLSVSFWVRPAVNNDLKYFMMCSDFGVFQQGGTYTPPHSLGLAISHPLTESAAGDIAGYGNWQHFLGTFDGTDIKVYINGQLQGQREHPGPISDPNRDLVLGYFSTDYWEGTIDELRIYDRVLSWEEIQELNNSISSLSFAPPSPHSLAHGDFVDITFDYFTNVPDGIRIFALPYTNGHTPASYSVSPSPLYQQGSGTITRSFTVNQGNVQIDEILFRFTNGDQSVTYFEQTVPVEYYFPETEQIPSGDLAIQSRWSSTPPTIDGQLGSGEWDNAPSLPLYDETGWPRGALYVLNDHQAFYLLVDLTADTIDDKLVDDEYAGIGLDIGLDETKTPYVDTRYATFTGTETLGIQKAVTDIAWTGLMPTDSLYAEGFGARPGSSEDAHTFFEYKLDFGELGIDFEEHLANPGDLYHARINVQAHSLVPEITVRYPASETGDWDRPMIRVSLDAGELVIGSGEPIISGIGLIPKTYIDQKSGLATTGPGHQLNVQDAPFGAHLRVIGNIEKLRTYGVEYFAIGYCNLSDNLCAPLGSRGFDWGDWQFVQDTRSNYYWDESVHRYVLENTGTVPIPGTGTTPKVRGYEMLSPKLDYYFDNLLFDWRTSGAVDVHSGRYMVRLFGFTSPILGDLITSLPAEESSLVVSIDNTPPVMKINSIHYEADEISACGVVQLKDEYHGLIVNVSAYDPDGYLNNLSLVGYFGDNQHFICESRTNPGVDPIWHGIMPDGDLVCTGDAGDHWETSCGYTFRISGWGRAINGYTRIHYRSYQKTISVLMPDYTNPNDKVELEDIIRGLQILTGSSTP